MFRPRRHRRAAHYFVLSTGYTYGLLTGSLYDSATSPAFVAFDELAQRAAAPATIGKAIPGVLTGQEFSTDQRVWGRGVGSNVFNDSNPDGVSRWAAYLFRATSSAARNVVLTISSASGTIAVFVDGNQVGTTMAATNGTMTYSAGTLNPGPHGVLVRLVSGSLTLASVAVQ